ncbi:uncharacterized protein LOC105447022 [Strongylocentrotus purpuratus]|uniref:Uncharacterized protein n=1 Tax=Strongylocentrotus purpuratus TaxID=7668 RepID=A0A7M7SY96_STRPU|nr:uncharacterized protein LOC105447022 [Strongylocentrotus purpuratus]
MSGKALLVSTNYASGDEFPIGSTVVKYVFADESGNEATCNFTVIVNSIDTTAPDVACIENITVNTGRYTGRNTSIEFLQPSATDISGTALLVSNNYGSGDEFPVGSTVVEYVFADESGNQATCNFTITINTYSFRDPVGLENGTIPDSSLTASSAWTKSKNCLPERARLHLVEERIGEDWFCGAWATAKIDSNPWIQVDLLTKYRIGGVSTQGRQRGFQWVTAYKINCSIDGITFDTVQDILTNPATEKVFVGNNDSSTVMYNALPQPKVCRYVRLLPVGWLGHISLRMELYGEPPVMDPAWVCMSSKCYRVDEKQRSWQDAHSFCRNLSTITTITGFKKPSLLFVDTDEYVDFLSRMGFNIHIDFWINCNDMLNEGDFICEVDGAGTRETTTYWYPGEPNGRPDYDEDCVKVSGWTAGHWVDVMCTRSYFTVCQILL